MGSGTELIDRFNIRVYGLYIDDKSLLVTDEVRKGIHMTKLPGGGLEFGEGINDCLTREWKEELSIDIEVGDVFYVNKFLQVSAFNPREQVISIYLWVKPLFEFRVEVKEKPMDFDHFTEGQQIFRWIPIDLIQPGDFTFPIDQALVPELKSYFL